MQLRQVVGHECLRRPTQGQLQRVSSDVGVAVTIATDPASRPQEAGRPPAQRTLPASIKRWNNRQENLAQIRERNIHFVRYIKTLAPQRSRLPKQCNLPRDALLYQLAVRCFCTTCIAQS